jgi:hypothetical protein
VNPALLEVRKIVTNLREDIRMLRDGEWVPDEESCQASIDAADSALDILAVLEREGKC